MPNKRNTVVYELFNKGRKVYIGITDDPVGSFLFGEYGMTTNEY